VEESEQALGLVLKLDWALEQQARDELSSQKLEPVLRGIQHDDLQ